MRSWLFVPGDSERKFAKAQSVAADVLILDLEDSVAPAAKERAREHVGALLGLGGERNWSFFVRVNALDTGMTLADLAAVVRPGLDGVLLPKANGAEDLERLGNYLEALEVARGLERNSVKIAVVATETPRAMFALGSYAAPSPRLAALTWGAEDLSSAVGATTNKEATGAWSAPYQLARSQCLFAATAAGVAPLETLYADFRDLQGLAEDCRASRRDGFVGRIAIHPDQVAIINESYSPSPADLAFARRLVKAFTASPNAGVVGLDGKMYDIPHLRGALRTLAAAGESAE